MNNEKAWHDFYEKDINPFIFIKISIINLIMHFSLLSEIHSIRSKRILEVGSGTGGMSVLFSYLLGDIVSIDNNATLIKKCEQVNLKFLGKVKFILMDAFNMTFKNDEFDVIFSQGFFEHFEDSQIRQLLSAQLRVSKHVIISIPSNFCPRIDKYCIGNERLLDICAWEKIISPLRIKKIIYYGGRPRNFFLSKPLNILIHIER